MVVAPTVGSGAFSTSVAKAGGGEKPIPPKLKRVNVKKEITKYLLKFAIRLLFGYIFPANALEIGSKTAI